jgi:hypothetical protein
MELYLHSPICLHGVYEDNFTFTLGTGRPRNWGSFPDKDKRYFFFSKVSRAALQSTQPLDQLGRRREADHSSPSSAKVKNAWSVHPLSILHYVALN